MGKTYSGPSAARVTEIGLRIRSLPHIRRIGAGLPLFRKPWAETTALSDPGNRKNRTTKPPALRQTGAIIRTRLHLRKRAFGAGLPALLVFLTSAFFPLASALAEPDPRVTLTPATATRPSARSAANTATTTDLLTFIRALEAPRGYTDYERRIRIRPPKPLTAMTLGEVLDWQVRVRNSGAPSTAAGGYQIIYPTLKRLVSRYELSRRQLFDARLQNRLARLLIAECGPRGARGTHPRYGNCLAGIWAALPLTQGRNKGRSAHRSVAGNRALTRPDTVLNLLAGIPVPIPDHGQTPDPRANAHKAPVREERTVRTLAFGARRITVEEVNTSLRKARRDNTLSPPVSPSSAVRTWKSDPYAQN